MNALTSTGSRTSSLVAAAKMVWGKLTADRWLQIEGRRLKYASLLKENTAFAQTRTPFRPSI